MRKRGYILPAYGSATIDGFRTSLDQVATFRFSSVADSYAGRLGQARDVGVIGVAFFPERAPIAVAPPPLVATSWPSDQWEGSSEYGGASRAPSASAPPAAPKSEAAPAPAAPARPSGGGANAAGQSASGALSHRDAETQGRRGLGTEFGEARDSHVEETPFVRANAASPSQVVAFQYNDRAGLIALGIRVDPPPPVVSDTELCTRETADPFRASRFAAPPP